MSRLHLPLLLLLLLTTELVPAQTPGRRKHRKAAPTWPVTAALPGTTLPAPGTVVDTLDGRPVYAVVEQMPAYPGGVEQLGIFMLRQLRYPPQYIRTTIEGRLFVSFIIDRAGQVQRPTLVRGLAEHLDEEALRVVRLLPRFAPGRHAGQAADVRYVLDLRFACTKGWSFGPTATQPAR